MKICIDYSDGQFYVKSTEEDDLFRVHAEYGATVIELTPEQWGQWQAHCQEAARWQLLFREADNSHG